MAEDKKGSWPPRKRNPHGFDKAYEDLYIQQRVYDLGKELWPVLGKVSKEQRWVLVQSMMEEFNTIKELIFVANKRYNKKDTLRQLDTEIGKLKMDMQWGNDLGYIKDPQFLRIAAILAEVGRMVGGWLLTEKEKAGQAGHDDGQEYKCADYGATIDARINGYSITHYKRPLCYKCQREEEKRLKAKNK